LILAENAKDGLEKRAELENADRNFELLPAVSQETAWKQTYMLS
jgi:hypothetical protein